MKGVVQTQHADYAKQSDSLDDNHGQMDLQQMEPKTLPCLCLAP